MRKLFCALLACMLLAGCLAAAEDGELRAVFYDVGKADAILLYTDAAAVLIDAGKNKAGKGIVEDLAARGIDRLDFMIVTHFDKDHVGGADAVVAGIPVGRVLEPDYRGDSKQLTQYREALSEAGIEAEALSENLSFALDGLYFEIDVANRDFYGEDEENDFSLVVRLRHGGVRFLFAADAENTRLAELIDEGGLSSDVLKVPHHGNYEKLSALFFEAVSPEYAVITSDEKEPEDPRVVTALQIAGAKVLLTREGTVELLSDGIEIELL
ncbi:MAG: MBL fold metallo-hydrolase [Clostridiales bacterium]|nr:MBL fold metallo-hydrolase [Clostridiales bacterium]